MKQVTKDNDSLVLKDFYDKYRKRKRSYDSSFLPYKDGRIKKVDEKLHKKIVKQYQISWFRDFLKTKGTVYFFLGGLAKKVVYKTRFLPYKKIRKNKIGIFWYKRPSIRSFFLVTIKKTRGTKVKVTDMENNYVKYNNIDYIPKFEDEIRDKKKKKNLFRTT